MACVLELKPVSAESKEFLGVQQDGDRTVVGELDGHARLNRLAIRTARQIRAVDSRAARWAAADALRELTSPAVQRRLHAQGRT